MDQDLYQQSVEYEQLTQVIYQDLLQKEGDDKTRVLHNQKMKGRSGVEHQIDVLWRHKKAGIEHTVIFECKNYGTALTLEKVRNFFAVLHDLGNCQGQMVTKTGYQSGAAAFAEFYGIGLKLVRKPTEEDWTGRLRTICVNLTASVLVSTMEKPVRVTVNIGAIDEPQVQRIAHLRATDRLQTGNPATMQFFNSKREPVDEVLGWWLPRNLPQQKAGGPYNTTIPLTDKYILVNPGDADEELILVTHLDVEYYIEEFDRREIVVHGDDVVQAILKDFKS
ncbi:MAG: hypothetical protein C0508_06435, partial [Cyanobacteria bacterium PR.023]|nr:hypothetical protein [Cyanobacteria bacterium PR.023]